jgi:putative oxidoreductase
MVKLGRTFFAIPLGVFGIQYLNYGHWTGGLPPVPPWTPGGRIFAYITGVVLLAISVSLLGKKEARFSATLLGEGPPRIGSRHTFTVRTERHL